MKGIEGLFQGLSIIIYRSYARTCRRFQVNHGPASAV